MKAKMSPRDHLRDGPELTGAALEARLEQTWRRQPGLIGWLSTTDHKEIGRRYLVTAFGFLVLGGILALLMRLQLARPESGLITPDRYNQIFTMHGTTMMFLFAVPVMEAMAVYLMPLMVGTRNIAFPRLNAFSYWMYLPAARCSGSPSASTSAPTRLVQLRAAVGAGILARQARRHLGADDHLHRGRGAGGGGGDRRHHDPQAARAGHDARADAALRLGDAGRRADGDLLDAVGGADLGLADLGPAGRHPFLQPAEAAIACSGSTSSGSSAIPRSTSSSCPATGFVSEIVRDLQPPPVFGYPAIVLLAGRHRPLAFGLWVHHMFATGLPRQGYSFYTAASMAVAIPAGIQIFCWIATMWDGRPRFAVPLLFVVGFIITFVIGGLTGVMLASVPIDLQVHDTYFVVAHFHYVLIGGAVFPLLGAITYWFPRSPAG
jgi:hypothetical protein